MVRKMPVKAENGGIITADLFAGKPQPDPVDKTLSVVKTMLENPAVQPLVVSAAAACASYAQARQQPPVSDEAPQARPRLIASSDTAKRRL